MTPSGVPAEETVEEFNEWFDEQSKRATLAIVAQPWSGRSALLESASYEVSGDATRLSLEPPADTPVSVPDSSSLFIENCHYLFHRDIDGFDRLEAFLRESARTETLVLTAWNEYAWQYLTAVTDVEQFVDDVFTLPTLTADDAAIVISQETGVGDPDEALETYADSVDSPEPENVRSRLQTAIRRRYRGSVVESHLDGLVADGAGNPAAICRLFEYRTGYRENGPPSELSLTYDESYVLWLVFSNERLDEQTLESLTDESIDGILSTLFRQQLLERDGGHVMVRPEAFGSVLSHLERRRLVW